MRLINRNSFTKNLLESLNENNIFDNTSKESLKDIVERDFQTYLEDRYDIKSFEELDNLKVTEDDVNDYFTGMFFEIMDYDDLDTANEAEKIIRNKYGLTDIRSDDYQEYDDGDANWAAEEEADAIDRLENRYGNVNESAGRVFKVNDTVYWVGAGNEISSTGTVIDIPTEGRMTIKWEDGNVNTYSMSHPDIQHEDDYDNWFNEDSEDDDIIYNESVKSKKKTKKEKKPEERVIMKQGNVTCLKKDNKFKVFEDADTNLVEYDNQEEAMRDALNRCGVNPDNELPEEKDDLKESTQYQVIKTSNIGPSNYQSEVHGTYDSYEQAEDICNELNAQGIGATINEVNEIDEALKKLLLKKEELYNDDTISDEDYYSQIEIIDNIIVNNYSVKDIEEAEKELGINS